jgi:dynein intermediate chain
MADEARQQRQKALADKKKRLEELKARRQQRGTQTVGAPEVSRGAAAANLDEYIEGLLQVPATSTPAAGTPANATAGAPTPVAAADAAAKGSETAETAAAVAATAAAVPAPAPLAARIIKMECFEMGTQTADDEFPATLDYDEEEQQPELAEDNGYDRNAVESSYRNYDEEDDVQEEAKVLTAEEVERELGSEMFSSFLNSAAKKVERVLGSAILADLLVDYDGETDGTKRIATKASDGSKFLSSRQIYECPRWTATRDVTDMDWSPLHRELMLCGYHMQSSTSTLGQPVGSAAVKNLSPDDTPSDSLAPRQGELASDGLALVWNLAMPGRPEHIFTCGSPVTSTRFHPTESPLIIGGCQSGQVVVWDVRAGRMPVQKSSLTTTASGNSKGHTHPISSMEIVEGGVSSSGVGYLQRNAYND